jgi:hypothetical protein
MPSELQLKAKTAVKSTMHTGNSMAHSGELKHFSLPKQETSNTAAPINNFTLKSRLFYL